MVYDDDSLGCWVYTCLRLKPVAVPLTDILYTGAVNAEPGERAKDRL